MASAVGISAATRRRAEPNLRTIEILCSCGTEYLLLMRDPTLVFYSIRGQRRAPSMAPPLKRIGRIAVFLPLVFLSASAALTQDMPSANRLQTTREVPNAFGVDSYTVTTVTATAFFPAFHLQGYDTSGSLRRGGALTNIEDVL